MKLIIIYGPPAVGKLTVARELSRLTGYKVFHNHLTVDLAYLLFPSGTKGYSDFVEKLRLQIIETAAKNKAKGMIFTFVYGLETMGGKKDNLFIKKIVRLMKKYNSQIFFIKLTCAEKEINKRLRNESRREFNKLSDVKKLNLIRKKLDIDSVIPLVDNQIIDNTFLSAKKVAYMIKSKL